MQAAGDAREDQPDIDGAGVARDAGEACGGRVLLQRGGKLLAVVDELADEAEEEAGASGSVVGGGRPILGRIGGVGLGGGWRGGHERNKNINEGADVKEFFHIGRRAGARGAMQGAIKEHGEWRIGARVECSGEIPVRVVQEQLIDWP